MAYDCCFDDWWNSLEGDLKMGQWIDNNLDKIIMFIYIAALSLVLIVAISQEEKYPNRVAKKSVSTRHNSDVETGLLLYGTGNLGPGMYYGGR
jgi:hypothetical protein